jgi:hypothetical protein
MEAKSPVDGNRLPIFKPLALLVVVVELAAGVAVLPLVVVFSGALELGQPANRNPVAIVLTLKAKAILILGIDYFHSSDIQEPESQIKARLLIKFNPIEAPKHQ